MRAKLMEQKCIQDERWQVIPDWSRYEVSTLGRIRNRLTKKVLRQQPVVNARGAVYFRVFLYRRDSKGNLHRGHPLVHRLVASAFLSKPGDAECVHHKDSNTANNAADNLEWVTQSQNVWYTWHEGGRAPDDDLVFCEEEEAPF